MKTTTLIILILSFLFSTNGEKTSKLNTDNTFIGTFEGLTQNMEFQFTDLKGHDYLFDEVAENLEYDLLDEKYVNQKFKVTWEKRSIPIMDEEGQPTGKTEDITIITHLEKMD